HVSWRRSNASTSPEHPTIVEVQHSYAGPAYADVLLQHRLEQRYKIGGSRTDHFQHLGGRGLLLQSLAQLALARFELLFQLVSVCLEVLLRPSLGLAATGGARSRLRFGRTKLAAACWALGAFERQGHLVGTATGPLPVGPAKDRAY